MKDFKSAYALKLKDPRWQKKKGELLAAAEFTCASCESKEKTLHAHHNYYEFGVEPWEYPDACFAVLCEDCHKIADEQRKRFREASKLLDGEEMDYVSGYILGIAIMSGKIEAASLSNAGDVNGFASAVSIPSIIITSSQIILSLNKGVITRDQVLDFLGMK
jgi:hypothetical protein